MNVHVVSSASPGCGIYEHSLMLADAATTGDTTVRISAEALNTPHMPAVWCDVLHLNYHRGLHSAWTPQVIRALRAAHPHIPITATFHDTYNQHPPEDLAWQIRDAVDALIVHEPCDLQYAQDLGAALHHVHCWPQGIPDHHRNLVRPPTPEFAARPWLGTVGHDFPWKNYDRLAEVTGECGWGFRLYVPERPDVRRLETWHALNPHCKVLVGLSTANIVRGLAQCTATAFLYTCANSGTSGAIRLGVAAGRPVIANQDCRQFRDLPTRGTTPPVHWISDADGATLRQALQNAHFPAWSPGALLYARQHSWRTTYGPKYRQLWQQLQQARTA